MDSIYHKATDIKEEIKISDYLYKHVGLSKTIIKRVKYGGVRLNGEVVHMRATVRPDDEILIDLKNQAASDIEPLDIPLNIVYEDEYILAVCKDVNMPTHPSRGNSLPTLAGAVMNYLGNSFVFRAISRLDRDTSGIVLIAKDQHTASILSADMKSGKFIKTYHAIVDGVPEKRSGTISAPIMRESEGSVKRIVSENGKSAITEYRVIEELECSSLIELRPITGRTHQIRVHMAYIGHPLTNDFLYGSRGDTPYKLHCTSLEFTHPATKENMKIAYTADFMKGTDYENK